MKLNCKPGDLAFVVSSRRSPENIGRVVRCVRLISDSEAIDGIGWINVSGYPTWLVESDHPLQWAGAGQVARRAYADFCLRPIRDPGDDAVDQTLEWLPVPTRTPETA